MPSFGSSRHGKQEESVQREVDAALCKVPCFVEEGSGPSVEVFGFGVHPVR